MGKEDALYWLLVRGCICAFNCPLEATHCTYLRHRCSALQSNFECFFTCLLKHIYEHDGAAVLLDPCPTFIQSTRSAEYHSTGPVKTSVREEARLHGSICNIGFVSRTVVRNKINIYVLQVPGEQNCIIVFGFWACSTTAEYILQRWAFFFLNISSYLVRLFCLFQPWNRLDYIFDSELICNGPIKCFSHRGRWSLRELVSYSSALLLYRIGSNPYKFIDCPICNVWALPYLRLFVRYAYLYCLFFTTRFDMRSEPSYFPGNIADNNS